MFGSAAAFGSVLALLLPESRGQPMTDSAEELELLYGRNSSQNSDNERIEEGAARDTGDTSSGAR